MSDDHVAIAQVIQRYFDAVDEKQFDRFADVFAAEAVLRYSLDESTGPAASVAQMVARMRPFVGVFRFTQHLAGIPTIEIDGDRATARTNLRAVHVQQRRDGSRSVWRVFGVYRDRLARTPAGWRIAERVFRALHVDGELLPADEVEAFPAPPWR